MTGVGIIRDSQDPFIHQLRSILEETAAASEKDPRFSEVRTLLKRQTSSVENGRTIHAKKRFVGPNEETLNQLNQIARELHLPHSLDGRSIVPIL